jgi:arabinose-5-phosphate isomerase
MENKIPRVSINDTISRTIVEISSKRLGATAVLDENGDLLGIITDGDLRRMLEKTTDIEFTACRGYHDKKSTDH